MPQIQDKKIIFGGRNNWNDLRSGKITKNEWVSKRDNQLYFRGDASRKGNPNSRIVENTLRITLGSKKYVHYNLFIPDKFKEELNFVIESGTAYNVRLIRKDKTRFRVVIDFKFTEPEIVFDFNNGCIGVDTNPDRIALSNISQDGNLIESKTLVNARILYGSTHKRDRDIGLLVKEVIDYAKENSKGITFENLCFKKEKIGSRKWKRKQSNFVWRKFIELLERKCISNGIQYKKVNPAFTSVIGKYKYRRMHNLTIHESAAYVIARRGMGFNEKLSFYKIQQERLKSYILETHAGKVKDKRIHSWRMWKFLDDNIEAVLTGLQVSLTDLKEFVDNAWYRGENLRGEIFLRELILGSDDLCHPDDEMRLSKFV